jgi:hypothetical protein
MKKDIKVIEFQSSKVPGLTEKSPRWLGWREEGV